MHDRKNLDADISRGVEHVLKFFQACGEEEQRQVQEQLILFGCQCLTILPPYRAAADLAIIWVTTQPMDQNYLLEAFITVVVAFISIKRTAGLTRAITADHSDAIRVPGD